MKWNRFCFVLSLLSSFQKCLASKFVFGIISSHKFSRHLVHSHGDLISRNKKNHSSRISIAKILSQRGGSSLSDDDSLMYFKVGLINLSSRPWKVHSAAIPYQIGSEEDSFLTSVVTQAIEINLSDELNQDDDDHALLGSIITLSSRNRSDEVEEISFHESVADKRIEDLESVVETIGCLSNIIVLVYDSLNPYRQKSMVKLIKGIERQRKSVDLYNGVDVIMLAMSDEDEQELNIIRNVLKNGNEEIYEAMKIIQIPKHGGDLNHLKQALRETEYAAIGSRAAVSMNLFPKLVKSVFSKLHGVSDSEKISVQRRIVKYDQSVFSYSTNSDPREEEMDQIQSSDSVAHVQDSFNEEATDQNNEKVLDSHGTNEEGLKNSDMIGIPDIEVVDAKNIAVETEEDEINDNNSDVILPDDSIRAEQMTSSYKDHETDHELKIKVENIEVGPSEDLRKAINDKIEIAISMGESILSEIESKQDEVLLNSDLKMPILEFGRDANNLLADTIKLFEDEKILKLAINREDIEFIENNKKEVLNRLNSNVLRLFEIQLQSLREFFGRKYEKVLDDFENDDINGELDEEAMFERRKRRDSILVEEAKKVTEGFVTAATNSIPSIVKDGELTEFHLEYQYDSVLDGLIRDMMHASSTSQTLEAEWDSATAEDSVDASEESSPKARKRGPVKWYEKLAARALVFGVNYAQGWLAYQGIKKAAAERDRLQPKFPLF